MATIVFGAHGLRSALNNTTALARLLVERGHDVAIISFRDVRAEVEHVGARFVWLRDGPDAAIRFAEHRARRGLLRSLRTGRALRREVLRLQEPLAVLADLDPDLFVIDVEMHGLVAVAEHLRLPTLLNTTGHDPTRRWSRPPMHRDIVGGTPLGYVSGCLAWADLIARRFVRHALEPMTRAGAIRRVVPQQMNAPDRATVREMMDNLDVDLEAIASRSHWLEPHTYRHRPIMSFTMREAEFDPDAPHGVVHVGPIVDKDRYRSPATDERRAPALRKFLAVAEDESRTVVYCSMGSMQRPQAAYYQRVIDAFADRPEWAVVVGLGGQGGAGDLVPATNVLVLEDAPQLEVLEHCDIAVHCGGASTFYECTMNAVASIDVHTGRNDMGGIAARIRHFDLGVVLDPDAVTADRIRVAAETVRRGSVQRSLARFATLQAAYGNGARAVELVERLAAGPGPETVGACRS